MNAISPYFLCGINKPISGHSPQISVEIQDYAYPTTGARNGAHEIQDSSKYWNCQEDLRFSFQEWSAMVLKRIGIASNVSLRNIFQQRVVVISIPNKIMCGIFIVSRYSFKERNLKDLYENDVYVSLSIKIPMVRVAQ